MDSSSDQILPLIEISDLHVLFGNHCALDIETLRVNRGERIFVLGRSGSGKTTLARLIKGRTRPSTGSIRVLDADPTVARDNPELGTGRRIAMIDQEFFLVPRMSVIANVLTGCLGRVSSWKSIIGWYPEAELIRAEAILREVELIQLSERKVDTLSGGQRQRTAIARALMQEAEIILADEPVSNLDPELAEDALELLNECVQRRGVTLLVNLHQPSLARRFADRIIGLSEGRVVYDGPTREFTEEKAAFLYQSNGVGEKVVPLHHGDLDRQNEA